ncbi:MAG: polysulfide reductase NrfD [Actinobacteria bacterium]|nr:polysulfide reductase NrfD [Actinomycetota bacterium]
MSASGAVRSYYGQPVIKEPVWTPEIPVYLFTGGLGGASAGLAELARLRGNEELARRAWVVALAGVAASPALLVSDLGMPSRFLNMLRMFKVTSPMSVGSWILSASGLATSVATANAMTGHLPRAARFACPAAALLGLPLSTYTAALLSNTAIPVWHESRRLLPFVFAGGAAASAGGTALAVTPDRHAKPARRLAVGGAVAQLAALQLMERSLGEIGEPLKLGPAGMLGKLAKGLTAAGAVTAVAGRGGARAASVAGGVLVTAGALAERWAVFRAGFQSAGDPKYVVGPQRERIERGEARGGSRQVGRRRAVQDPPAARAT